jgi:ferredoxin-NADP reductase
MSSRLIMTLDVVAIERIAADVSAFTFRHPRRPMLPPPTAGSHVDLHLPDGRVRQYSLCGDPADASIYRVAIKREDQGRGGSRWIHETLTAGATLRVSAPRNHFPLAAEARHHILVAGGIGVTPMLAMVRALRRTNGSFELHYCARGPAPAFIDELAAICEHRLSVHSGSAGAGRLDAHAMFSTPRPGIHVYCCGPQPLMQAVRAATSAWPEDSVHTEAFKPLVDENFLPQAFDLELAMSGTRLHVPHDRTALEVLRDHGLVLPSSCEIGVCGSCECGYRQGEAIHRDVVLSPAARRSRFMPCVSRARGRIVLDL